MSLSTAIGMVSESMRNLLEGEMAISPKPEITILAPDENSGDRRINLFLYKIQENPTLKNLDWQVKPGSPGQLVPPPLSLNLFYLMTPYSKNDQQTGNSLAHEILGEAMRIFYENPIIPRVYLPDELKDSREQIRIMLNTLDLDELSKVWATFTTAFRLSVLYEVSVVQLDMLPEKERIMAERVQAIGVPDLQSSYTPPVIETIEPLSGTAGSEVCILGKNFTGWKAYVYISGRKIVDGQGLSSDSFTVTLPGDLVQGFHEIQVDISHLSRQTFLFEVTG